MRVFCFLRSADPKTRHGHEAANFIQDSRDKQILASRYVWYHFVRCDALRCIACVASRLVRSSPAPFRQMCFEGLLAESRFSAVKGRRFMIRLKCVTAGLLARVCSLDRLLVCSFARLLACSLGRLHACSLARCLYVRTDKQFLLNQVYCPWPGPAINVQNIPTRLYVTLSMQGR